MAVLQDKIAIVTGAGNGIGYATVERFLREGAKVVAMDRKIDHQLKDPGLIWLEGDVTDEADVARAVDLTKDLGGVDICVANAGVGQIEPFFTGSKASWSRVIDVNLIGVMMTLQASARQMAETGRGGRLLATASIAGLRGEPHAPSTAYAASKGAIMALIRSLAMEMAVHKITANAVAPGQIDTAMNASDLEVVGRMLGQTADELRSDFLKNAVPAGRMGQPSEVAGLFAYLASEEASFITGTTFRIDGGELSI